MSILSHAARIAKALTTSDPGNHRGCKTLRDQSGTLLDVQLEIGADPTRLEEPAPLADGGRIETAFQQGFLQGAAIIRTSHRKARRIQLPEGTFAAQVGDVEPRGL